MTLSVQDFVIVKSPTKMLLKAEDDAKKPSVLHGIEENGGGRLMLWGKESKL